ncbi:MAG TPA: RNA polymerase factor sigma-32 [Polyangiaceae bacterium LLY-WYZ-15_(1-7)]|nr:RNA polymerase factor sigma-32 [Polyangiaceae bacterium LLY-WYZ-15_(1-7)]HJL03999.1 RNA polymerase factor sigma-32 [Polyangiaceae bacterium LLY-WYZ-15_(1-7)]HJL10537.1 RNA polymerase factor sigma-32 [Polyangiaceae bacterium LLY-WYZ-15_(1-7)]HJL31000.1 RNA polymerase factor sigma-32 [Polyangiaceae bacterium LLY-WYZ-15_(1-7)]HJL38567.1 RNA polymerase factor sigma-32 [Polyangiaceae bacterium LLY-WYZ-15_(1-7)]
MAYQKDPELDRYIDKVRKIPTLSREDEHDLAVRVRDEDDQRAADALVQANLRYVVAVALQYRRYGVPLGDLIAEGSVGLVTAVRKFDPDRGTRFVTYAGYWIRAFVLEAVVRSTSLVGAGSGPLRSKLFFRLRRERARVANIEQDPTKRIEIMAERFGVSFEKMEKMLRRLEGKDVSLDGKVFDDSGLSLVDTLVAEADPQDEVVARRTRQERIELRLDDALDALDQRERYIVENRLLQDDDDEMTLAALGRELGVSRERARQLEARAKQKLRQRLRDFAAA